MLNCFPRQPKPAKSAEIGTRTPRAYSNNLTNTVIFDKNFGLYVLFWLMAISFQGSPRLPVWPKSCDRPQEVFFFFIIKMPLSCIDEQCVGLVINH
jgi:hypothetical protein